MALGDWGWREDWADELSSLGDDLGCPDPPRARHRDESEAARTLPACGLGERSPARACPVEVEDIAVDLDEARGVAAEVAFGVPIWIVNITGLSGCEELADSLVAGTTVALLGPSGVGKSSLVNRLAGNEVLQTGEVRSGDKKGRHTTTRRELVRLEGGALLLDTPGMRELQLWELETGLAGAFPRSKDWPTTVDSGTANTNPSRNARYLLRWLQARSAVQGLTAT